MTGPKTIAVAYASIGSGHRVAAEAIAAEIEALAGDTARIELIDVLQFGAFSGPGESESPKARSPRFAHIYDTVHDGSARLSAGTFAAPFLRAAHASFTAKLIAEQPDSIVCTHALPALLAAAAVRRGALSGSVTGVVTDYSLSTLWPRTGVDTLCLSHEELTQVATGAGFSPSLTRVTGIPVRRQFMLDYDVAAARRHFDLPEDRRVLLALAGASNPNSYAEFARGLEVALPALASVPGSAVAVVTGRDSRLADELKSRAHGFGTKNVLILGFVDRMAPLIAAADLVIARPGGVVSAECLAVGTPLLLVGPATGRERSNVTVLVEAGAAQYTADPLSIAEKTRNVLSRPARLASLRKGALVLARPFAARDIAERVLGIHADAPGA